MNKKLDGTEQREYFRRKNEPILISDALLEEAGINPNEDIHIILEHGAIIIQPSSILGTLPEELLLFYEDMGFSREVVEAVLTEYVAAEKRNCMGGDAKSESI